MAPTPPPVSDAAPTDETVAPTGSDLLTLSRPRTVLVAALAMIVAQLAFRAWAVLGSWYRYDDANFMAKLLADGLSTRLMFHGYAGHLMPGAFAATAFNFSRAPYAWVWPATELLVLQALASAGALVFLVSAFGRRPGILVPLALFLFSPLSLPASLTWGPGITQLPFLAAIFWGGWTNLRYLRTRRFGWALATMVITVVAVGFGEKAMLVLWTYAVVALCWFASGDLIARLRQVGRRYLAGVVLHVLVAAGAVAAYVTLASGAGSVVRGHGASAQELAQVGERLVLSSWATGVLGGPLKWRWVSGSSAGLAAPNLVLVGVAVALIAVLTWEIARTRCRAMRAWWLVGGILGADVVLVTVARAGAAGPDLALAFRYLTETAAVSAMALGLATMPLVGAVEAVEVRRASGFLDVPRRVGGATAAVAALGLFSSLTYVQGWHADDSTERYVRTVRADLAQAPDALPFVDAPVPGRMVGAPAYPDNLVSHVLAPLRSKMLFPQVSTNTIYMVDDHGHVRHAGMQAVRHAAPSATAAKGCPYPVAHGAVRVPLDGPVFGEGWWLHVSYRAPRAGTMHVRAGEGSYDVPVEQGFHSLYVRTRGGDFTAVSFDRVSPGSMTCVGALDVGHLVPFGPAISAGAS